MNFKPIFGLLPSLLLAPSLASAEGLTAIPGHVPHRQMVNQPDLGQTSSGTPMKLAVTLKLADPDALKDFITRLYDPADPLFHQFLTPEEFTARFSPTQQDYDRVASYLESQGFQVSKRHANRLVLDVVAPVSTVQNGLNVQVEDFVARDGRVVHAPTSDPSLPDSIARHVNGIHGLQNFSKRKHHLKTSDITLSPNTVTPHASISDYVYPSRLKTIYNLNSTGQDGTGQSIALFELDGFTSSDITTYATNFSLGTPTVQTILVDGFNGTPTSNGSLEVTLDIELALAVAPKISVKVYEGSPSATDAEVIDIYTRIATDNSAKTISTSWGMAENEAGASFMNSENTIFQQYAAQGQTFFAASGDNGAYDDSSYGVSSLQVDDPGSQPYATAVGGTTLTWNTSTSAYTSETSWHTTPTSGTYPNSNYVHSVGGGGGVSTHWTQPTWQSGLNTTANLGSASMRMTPDVSMDADPATGYPVYASGAWHAVGGTSCGAPIWAAFIGLVNQRRAALSYASLGYFNPIIYGVARGTGYATNFHDISDGSTNLYYPAQTGFDLTTGWGSFNGGNLYTTLTSSSLFAPTLALTPGPSSMATAWTAVNGATNYTLKRSTSSGGTYTSVYSGTSTSYSDASLADGTYYYTITVTTSAGTATSSPVSATVLPPPGVPGNLTAASPENN